MHPNVGKEIGDYSVPVIKEAALYSAQFLDHGGLIEGRKRHRGSLPLVKRPRVGCEVMDDSSAAMNDIMKQK